MVGCVPGEPVESRYETAVAEIGDVRDSVPAVGTLIAPGAAEIRTPQAGVIAAVHVEEGDTVRAGQVLATLASPTRVPSREAAAAEAAAADPALREAEIGLERARENLERVRTLQDRDFASQASVRIAETAVEQARAAVDQRTDERTAARARFRLAAAEGAGSDIVAPLDGIVTLATAHVGQRVSPEDERALFQTSQGVRELTLEILVAESDLSRVSMESRVVFSVDAHPGITETAELISIGEAPIRQGRFVSYRALARFDNFAEFYKPGMSASVQLVRADARSVLRVPIRATYYLPPDYTSPLPPGQLEELIAQEHGDMRAVRASASGLEIRRMLQEGFRRVFVLEDGGLVRREVRIGAETDEFIEITEGLRPGEIVILDDGRDPRDAV